MPLDTKVCSACKETKSLAEFKPKSTGRGTGYEARCRSCLRLARQKYYRDNKERWRDYDAAPGRREYKAEWYQKSARTYRDRNLRRHYGITIEQYEEMLQAQDGVCAICKRPEKALNRGVPTVLHVDHHHGTGKVRALLCSDCNRGLGCFQENEDYLRAALAYLTEHTVD